MSILDQLAKGQDWTKVVKSESQGQKDAMTLQGASQDLQIKAMKMQAYTEQKALMKRSRGIMMDADLSSIEGTRKASQDLFGVGNMELGFQLEADADAQEGAIANAAAKRHEVEKMYSYKENKQQEDLEYKEKVLKARETKDQTRARLDRDKYEAQMVQFDKKHKLGMDKLDSDIKKWTTQSTDRANKLQAKVAYQQDIVTLKNNQWQSKILQHQDKMAQAGQELTSLNNYRSSKSSLELRKIGLSAKRLDSDIKKAQAKFDLKVKEINSLIKKRESAMSIDERKLNVLLNDKTSRLKLDQDKLASLNRSRDAMVQYRYDKLAYLKNKAAGRKGKPDKYKIVKRAEVKDTMMMLSETKAYNSLEKGGVESAQVQYAATITQAANDLMVDTRNAGNPMPRMKAMQLIAEEANKFIIQEGIPVPGVPDSWNSNKFDKEGFMSSMNKMKAGLQQNANSYSPDDNNVYTSGRGEKTLETTNTINSLLGK